MKQKNLLFLTLPQLKKCYERSLPRLCSLAHQSGTPTHFKEKLRFSFLPLKATDTTSRFIHYLLEYDGQTIYELSRGEKITLQPLTLLWHFLTGTVDKDQTPDLYLDLYFQFLKLQASESNRFLPTALELKNWMERWKSGIDPDIICARQANKERMMGLLVQKIEHRHHPSSRYVFPEGISQEEKYRLVNQWWEESRFHLAMAIKSPTELNRFLNYSLSGSCLEILTEARKKGIPFFATPYYLSLLDVTGKAFDDEAIRSYILYSSHLVKAYGSIRAWEREDKIESGKPNAAGWLLPEGHNIHRRYPEVAILIPDSMGRACGGLCASCQRMYDFQSQRLNFELESLKPKEAWEKKLGRLMSYFEEDNQLRDILITGGDAFMSQNKTLRNLLDAVYKMAIRKKKANEFRKNGEKRAEIQRVRLGSRLPVYLPMRINDELIGILKEFREKASAIGIRQFFIQTHFQSPLEMTPEARKAIQKIISAGWTVTNQLVFNVAASRRGHTARLRQVLNEQGILCYYTFSVKGFDENYEVFAPNSRSLQEEKEEKIFGKVPEHIQEVILSKSEKEITNTWINDILYQCHLPFLSTDRNVLNLPAVGKSMTFETIGIMPDGKRVLKFHHDANRRHSPIIDGMDQVYILENKSLRAYLSELVELGENPEEYASLWHYTEGTTESRFTVYDYPSFPFEITKEFSNLEIG